MPKHPTNHNLYQNHLTWTFRFNWPADVRDVVGKRELHKSLQTQDLVTARFKRDRLLAECKLFVKEVREKQEREVKQQLAEDYAAVKDDEEFRTMQEEAIFGEAVERLVPGGYAALEKEAHKGVISDEWGAVRALGGEVAEHKVEQFISEVTSGDISTPFNAYLSEWLAERKNKVTAQTLDDCELSVKRFSMRFATVGTVKTRDVRDWFKDLGKKLSASRVNTYKQSIHAYWRYLQEMEVIDPDGVDPFRNIPIEARGTKSYKPFEIDDCMKLLEAAEQKGDGQLADLILLALYTGMRIEEACSLKIEDVKPDHLLIPKSKTIAGERKIPIHSALKPLMEAMITASKDGYVVSKLCSKNMYKKRHSAISKRFGSLKRKKGFGSQHVFHSLRKTVVTLLEQASVPEGIAADIVGHKKQTMTYGVYSGGSSMKQKQDAIEKLEYPPLPELTKKRLLGS